mmetsp:Transcript_51261/g.145144  ORF Transcript_51261/g.145144 Transcript_51261/m.145144 type:complete len:212 (-) Transcript_51261:346-981(-)
MPSMSVPHINNVYIDMGTSLKYMSPTSVSTVSWVNAMPNMYNKRHSKHKVKKTERVAAAMPLIKIINSGMARRRRAIRAMRVSRARRAMRKMDASPNPLLLSPPDMSMKMVSTHVSITIMKTRRESKTNQPSLKPCLFFWKALKRVNHSKAKKKQKTCSAIWNCGSACNRTSAVLPSVSTPIQMAFKPIIVKVILSNLGLFAIACQMPSVL